jgi:hypothetical protein
MLLFGLIVAIAVLVALVIVVGLPRGLARSQALLMEQHPHLVRVLDDGAADDTQITGRWRGHTVAIGGSGPTSAWIAAEGNFGTRVNWTVAQVDGATTREGTLPSAAPAADLVQRLVDRGATLVTCYDNLLSVDGAPAHAGREAELRAWLDDFVALYDSIQVDSGATTHSSAALPSPIS